MNTQQHMVDGRRVSRRQCVRCQAFFIGGSAARYCLEHKETRRKELTRRSEERRRARRKL